MIHILVVVFEFPDVIWLAASECRVGFIFHSTSANVVISHGDVLYIYTNLAFWFKITADMLL